MKEFLLTYPAAFLISGVLWAIFLLWKIKPVCSSCMSVNRQLGSLTTEVVEERRRTATAQAELKEAREENKKLVERMLAHVGVRPIEPSKDTAEEKAQRAAEVKRKEELESRGGAGYGGGAD